MYSIWFRFLALQSQLWVTALLSFAVAGFGYLYHLSNENRFFAVDAISAWLLIVSNLVLCYLGDFQSPYFYIALLFLTLALFYHYYPWSKAEYDLNHGLWHLHGALITLFCIFTLIV